MEQRSPDHVSRVLCQRETVDYFDGENSEEENDYVEDADSDTSVDSVSDVESENEESETEEEPENESGVRRRKFLYGKDKYKWCLNTPEIRGRRSNNNIAIDPKAIGAAASSHTPIEFWGTLFSQDILEVIVQRTNEEIERYVAAHGNGDSASFQKLTLIELKAFIGLLYFCGVQNNNKVNLSEIWSRQYGSLLCQVTMSQRRFQFISCRLRFDDKITRAARRAEDVLAPIREIWDKFILNCETNYNPSESVTIDEQLLAFRGRFSARVYIKSKPARYGIKIVSMNDANTYYMYNATVYW